VKKKIVWCLSLAGLLIVIASVDLTRGVMANGSTGNHDAGWRAKVVNVNCSNTKVDAARLNDAISRSSVGSEIAIHGTCLINQTIVLGGNRSYIGDSRTGTILRQASGANLEAMLASDSWNSNSPKTGNPIRIAHLTLDGNSDAGGGSRTNALVIRSWQTVVEDLLVENASGDGIQITTSSKNGTLLKNTQVNGRISDVFITNSGGNGIHVVDKVNSATDSDILNSWIAGSGQSGISMDNAAGWKIRGNHIYGVQQNAIYAHRCYGTTIDSNYIEDFGGARGATTYYGIACTVQGDAASVISGNKIFRLHSKSGSGKYVYIGVPQVRYGTGVINVANNVINGANGKHDIGLLYELGSGAGLKVWSANNIQNVAIPRIAGSGVTFVTTQ
jgi:hypothetical protein